MDVRIRLYERYLIHDTGLEALTTDQVPVTRKYFDGFSLDVFWVLPCEIEGFMLDVLITDSCPTSLCVFFWNACNVGESLDSLVFGFVCGYTTEIDIRRTLRVCDFWMRSTIRLVYRVSHCGLILIPEYRLGTDLQNVSAGTLLCDAP